MSDAIGAVSVALVSGDRVLMVRRARAPAAGLYAFPGGRIEPGETALEAARRELMEETGLTAGDLEPLREIAIEPEDGDGRRFALTVFRGVHTGGEAVAADDAAAVGWFTLAELLSLPVTASTLEVAAVLLRR